MSSVTLTEVRKLLHRLYVGLVYYFWDKVCFIIAMNLLLTKVCATYFIKSSELRGKVLYIGVIVNMSILLGSMVWEKYKSFKGQMDEDDDDDDEDEQQYLVDKNGNEGTLILAGMRSHGLVRYGFEYDVVNQVWIAVQISGCENNEPKIVRFPSHLQMEVEEMVRDNADPHAEFTVSDEMCQYLTGL